jgi:hypothetical protein
VKETDESHIRTLIESWAKGVHGGDMEGVYWAAEGKRPVARRARTPFIPQKD